MTAHASPTTAIAGLQAPVDLFRDPWGIPHIRAANAHDAFLTLGHAHAQDRARQMDMTRRRAVGRWAEWRCADAIKSDRMARRLGAASAAQRDLVALSPEARGMLDAYAAGVNALIQAGAWPPEYALLDAEPERWEPWHSIAVMRQIGFLMGSLWLKLFRAAALPAIGAERVAAP